MPLGPRDDATHGRCADASRFGLGALGVSETERPSRPIDAKAPARVDRASEPTALPDVVRQLPRRDGRETPFGGRGARRQRKRLRPWPDEEQARELTERARRFLDETAD